MFRLFTLVAASGISLILAACETAPMVVEVLPPPEATTTKDLLVLPLAGLSPTVGGALGEKMAWGMREAGYPARSASLTDESNPMLTGWIEEASDGGDIIWLNINWAVYGVGGTLLGSYKQETAVSRSGWSRLSPETLGVIVAQAVPAIHEVVEVEVYPDGMPNVDTARVAASEVTLIPPKQETIVVSGEGLSHIDSSGIETRDAQSSVAAEPTFAPDYVPEATPQGNLPEGFSSPGPAAPASITSAAVKPSLDVPFDSVDRLTPESAALVTTTPELTIAEPITPTQETFVDEGLMELGLEAEEVGVAPGNTAVSPSPTVAAPQPEQPVPSVAAVAPQPTLSDGNAVLSFVRPVFLVRHVAGAPGEGNLALRTAMLSALRSADAMVTDSPTQASYIIQGSVQVSAPFAGRQHTRIVWLVTTITGEEVGTAVQENDIPEGSLDGSWKGVAQAIANSAIPGVAQLFDTGLDAGTAQGKLSQPDLPHVFADPLP